MSLLRRRTMMQGELKKVLFSDLSMAKCIFSIGGYDIENGIRFDFFEERDEYAVLDFIVESGKAYELEFDCIAEKDVWNTTMIVNVYYGVQWYFNKGCAITYVDGKDHYKAKIEPYTEDRKISLIGNSMGTSTGYTEFKNLIIKET